MMEPTVMETTATRKGSFTGRAVRVAVLFLLFGLLAPPGASPGPVAPSGNPASGCVSAGDNSPVLPPNLRVSECLFGLPGLSSLGRVAPGIFRGAQPEPGGTPPSRRWA